MSTERKKVLQMLADGKISVEDAERLLERLAGSGDSGGSPERIDTEGKAPRPALPKYLRVLVDSADGEKVNIRVPLALVRTGIRLSTMLPSEANEKLATRGIDLGSLGKLSGEELMEALKDLSVDVDSEDGDTVRVYCE